MVISFASGMTNPVNREMCLEMTCIFQAASGQPLTAPTRRVVGDRPTDLSRSGFEFYLDELLECAVRFDGEQKVNVETVNWG